MSDDQNFDDYSNNSPKSFEELLKALTQAMSQDSNAWTMAQGASAQAGATPSEPNVDPRDRIAYEQLCRVAEMQVNHHVSLDTAAVRELNIRPATRREWAQSSLDELRWILEPAGSKTAKKMIESSELDFDALELPAELPIPKDFLKSMLSSFEPMAVSMLLTSMTQSLSETQLGAYDLPLPRHTNKELLVVSANISDFVEEWSLPQDDVRLWVCLHSYLNHVVLSLDHVRDSINNALMAYIDAFEPNHDQVNEMLMQARHDAEDDPLNSDDPFAMFKLNQSPDALLNMARSHRQVAQLPHTNAIFAVIVGWVDHMIEAIGKNLIGSFSMVTEALHRRRVTEDRAKRFNERLLGIELDQNCYDRGRAFIEGIIERGGSDVLSLLWQAPENLPTAHEVDAPGLWLERLGIDYEFEANLQDLPLSTFDEAELNELGISSPNSSKDETPDKPTDGEESPE